MAVRKVVTCRADAAKDEDAAVLCSSHAHQEPVGPSQFAMSERPVRGQTRVVR